jgi:hypothetical protein
MMAFFASGIVFSEIARDGVRSYSSSIIASEKCSDADGVRLAYFLIIMHLQLLHALIVVNCKDAPDSRIGGCVKRVIDLEVC